MSESNNGKLKAEEWFEKAKHDFESARLIIENEGYPDISAVLLQQAAEKYLKGYLISRGWKLVKTHDLKLLIDEAVKYDSGFGDFYDLADELTQCYISDKYPPSTTDVTSGEAKKYCDAVQAIISLIGKGKE
ncbi:MAG: HEPN domain-containing protein [Elusimicrobiota bacterium]